MIRRLPYVVAIALAATSCMFTPSTRNATSVLRSTAGNLGDIKSGELFMRLETSVKDGDVSGFELEGPFSLISSGDLPIAKIKDTHFDGDRMEEATFVSTGSKAYVVAKGRTRQIDDVDLASLRGLVVKPGAEDDEGGAGRLDVGSWIEGDPEVTAGGLIGGVDTDQVKAEVNPGEVMRGIVQLSRAFGAGRAAQLPELSDAEVRRVKSAVKSATMDIWTGKEDRILRKLVMVIEFGTPDRDLAEKIKALTGVRIRLETAITKVNEPVKVEAPSGADR